MVYSGSDVSAMFDAADANNGDLTKDIWEAYGGPERATLKQCRRRYKSTKAKAAAQDEDEGCEEDEETQTPAKKGKASADRSFRTGSTTQSPTRDTPLQAEVKSSNKRKRRENHLQRDRGNVVLATVPRGRALKSARPCPSHGWAPPPPVGSEGLPERRDRRRAPRCARPRPPMEAIGAHVYADTCLLFAMRRRRPSIDTATTAVIAAAVAAVAVAAPLLLPPSPLPPRVPMSTAPPLGHAVRDLLTGPRQ